MKGHPQPISILCFLHQVCLIHIAVLRHLQPHPPHQDQDFLVVPQVVEAGEAGEEVGDYLTFFVA